MPDAGCLTCYEADESDRRFGQLYNRLRIGQAGLEEFFRLKEEIFAKWHSNATKADSIMGLKDIVGDAVSHGKVLCNESDMYRRLNEENDHAIAGINWASSHGMNLDVSYGFIRLSDLGGRGMILFTEFPNESSEFKEPATYVDFCEYVLSSSGRPCDLKLYGKE